MSQHNEDEKDLLLKEMARRLLMACDTFRRGAYYLRQLMLVAQGQVSNLGGQQDLDNATDDQKNAWNVFNEANSILYWFDQQHALFQDLSKPAAVEEPAKDEPKAGNTPPTVH